MKDNENISRERDVALKENNNSATLME